MRIARLIPMTIMIAITLCACGDESGIVSPGGGGKLLVSISADPVEFVPGRNVEITVTLYNPTGYWINRTSASNHEANEGGKHERELAPHHHRAACGNRTAQRLRDGRRILRLLL